MKLSFFNKKSLLSNTYTTINCLVFSLMLTLGVPLAQASPEIAKSHPQQQGFNLIVSMLQKQFEMKVGSIVYDEANDKLVLKDIICPIWEYHSQGRSEIGFTSVGSAEIFQPQWENFTKDNTNLLAEKIVYTNFRSVLGNTAKNGYDVDIAFAKSTIHKPQINLMALMALVTKGHEQPTLDKLQANLGGIELWQLAVKMDKEGFHSARPEEEIFLDYLNLRNLQESLGDSLVDFELKDLTTNTRSGTMTLASAKVEKIALPTGKELEKLHKLLLDANAPNSSLDKSAFLKTILSGFTTLRPGRPPYSLVDLQNVYLLGLMTVQEKGGNTKEFVPLLDLASFRSTMLSPTVQNPTFTIRFDTKGKLFTNAGLSEHALSSSHPFNYNGAITLQPSNKLSTIDIKGQSKGHELSVNLKLLLHLGDLSNIVFNNMTLASMALMGSLQETNILYKDSGLMDSIMQARTGESPSTQGLREDWLKAIAEVQAKATNTQDKQNLEQLVKFINNPRMLHITQGANPIALPTLFGLFLSPLNQPVIIRAE